MHCFHLFTCIALLSFSRQYYIFPQCLQVIYLLEVKKNAMSIKMVPVCLKIYMFNASVFGQLYLSCWSCITNAQI